jgi:lysophospholipase L1-like esterase
MRRVIPLFSVFMGLAGGLAFAEVIVRILYPELPDTSWESRLFCKDTVHNVRMMQPYISGFAAASDFGSVLAVANSNGYRDNEWHTKKASKHRIMVLGDSFAWGWGVPGDSMITTVLDESDADLSVYNLGIPGDDLRSMYARFKLHLNEISPTHILIMNCINDFWGVDFQREEFERNVKMGLLDLDGRVSLSCNRYYSGSMKSILNRSYFFRIANRFRFRYLLSSKDERTRKQEEELRRDAYRGGHSVMKDTSWFNAAADFYRPLLKEISQKADVTILLIPGSDQADSTMSEEVKSYLGGIKSHVNAANEGMARLASEFDGVTFLDPTQALFNESRKRQLYFRTDGHLNPAGQWFLGQWLVERIRYR